MALDLDIARWAGVKIDNLLPGPDMARKLRHFTAKIPATPLLFAPRTIRISGWTRRAPAPAGSNSGFAGTATHRKAREAEPAMPLPSPALVHAGRKTAWPRSGWRAIPCRAGS